MKVQYITKETGQGLPLLFKEQLSDEFWLESTETQYFKTWYIRLKKYNNRIKSWLFDPTIAKFDTQIGEENRDITFQLFDEKYLDIVRPIITAYEKQHFVTVTVRIKRS